MLRFGGLAGCGAEVMMPSTTTSTFGAPIKRRTFLGGVGVAAFLGAIGSPTLDMSAAHAATPVSVYRSMLAGALVYRAAASSTIVGSAPGLGIRPEGDVYITDRAAFLAALPFTLTTSSGAVDLSLSDEDYLDQEALRANTSVWFDSADQRSLVVSSTGVVEEWACRVDTKRKARNDQYPAARPTRPLTSQAGADRPAVRFAPPSASGVYGLFFAASPLFTGLQRLAFSSATQLQLRLDNTWSPNLSGQSQIAFPGVTLSSSPVATLNIFVAQWTAGGDLVYRLNGTQVGSQTAFAGGFKHDGLAAIVFYANNAGYSNVSQVISAVGIGNAYVWKSAGFTGDIFEIWGLNGVDE